MPHRYHPVLVDIALPAADFQVYVKAARILARIMGAQAPDVATLINHELSHRKPQRIAEEYLYFIGWYDPAPGKPGRPG